MQNIQYCGWGMDGCNTYNKWMSKYTFMQLQNGQHNAKYSILWLGDGWVEYLQQADEQVFMKVVMAGLDKKVPKTPSHDELCWWKSRGHLNNCILIADQKAWINLILENRLALTKQHLMHNMQEGKTR